MCLVLSPSVLMFLTLYMRKQGDIAVRTQLESDTVLVWVLTSKALLFRLDQHCRFAIP